MSVLEFIAAWKWPVVVLVALAVVSRGFKRNPDMGAWFRQWLDSRDVRGKIGPTEFEATASEARFVQAAAASDEQLASLNPAVDPNLDAAADVPPSASDVASLRREAVEGVMRTAARWGWQMAELGFRDPPIPVIRWQDGDLPEIFYGRSRDSDGDVSERAFRTPSGWSMARGKRFVVVLKDGESIEQPPTRKREPSES